MKVLNRIALGVSKAGYNTNLYKMPESFHPVVLGVRHSTGTLDAPLGN